jgi:hypothetical protein
MLDIYHSSSFIFRYLISLILCNLLSVVISLNDSTKVQPTTATTRTTDTTTTTTETTAVETSVSVPIPTNVKKTRRTKAQQKRCNNLLDRFFAGRLLYFILMLSALALLIVGLMMIILNNIINAGNVSSQVAVLHLFRIQNPGDSSSPHMSQKQNVISSTIWLDDAKSPKELPPQAGGGSNQPAGQPENSSSYPSFVVINVLGACLTFFGSVLGIVVVLLIIQAKKRQQNGINGT